MESIVNELYRRLSGEALHSDHHLRNFTLVSHDDDGSPLHGYVKQVTPEDYHVFVREKDAIIGYRKNGSWVKQIGKKLASRLI
jgi:hypothetical protein